MAISFKPFPFRLINEYVDKKVFGSWDPILDGLKLCLIKRWLKMVIGILKTEKVLNLNCDQLEHAPAESPKEKALEFGALGGNDVDLLTI